MQTSYWRFAAMIATSTLVMFGLMYIHTWVWDHARFSETRAWMALLMGSVMAIVMLSFMLNMYQRRGVNVAIFAGAAIAFGLTTWLVRGQATVDGVDYMQAMIPHHSIAILTSERAGIEDPRVRKLADEIIAAQRKEISEMKYLVRSIDAHGVQPGERQAPPAEVASAADAVRLADVARADLEPLRPDEVARVLGDSPTCRFAYSEDVHPVAVAGLPRGSAAARGVVKLHGRLVEATARYAGDATRGFELAAGDVAVGIAPYEAHGETWRADGTLRIGNRLHAGYDGFYACET